MTKKRKIIIIVLSVIAILLALIIGGGLYALNWYCTPDDYEIVSANDIINDDTKIIAHRGFRAMAPENTAPAFEEAGKAGYFANECDIYRTADGVWVVQHDVITYRMMNCIKNVEKTTYNELMNYITDNGNNIENYPDLKLCTLEEYMEICQKYDMDAVIEIKGTTNMDKYGEIVELVSKYPNVDVTYISFEFENIERLRQLCDNPLMYLVHNIKDKDIELAKSVENCGINFDGNRKKNQENDYAMVKKCQAQGLATAAWTIDNKEVMKGLLNAGVNMITTNCITY